MKVVMMYDFDGTLAPGNMQEFTFISQTLKMTNENFWGEINDFGKKNNMDQILSMMYGMITISQAKNIKITKDVLVNLGKYITFFNGVESWFKRINAYAKTLDIEIDHFIISSGLKEIIEGTSIAKYFKKIFASCFCYDKDGIPFWPAQAINETTKTQFIYRIRKGQLDDLNDVSKMRTKYKKEDKIAYTNMFYFGDGETDIPSMKTIGLFGGHTILVYEVNNQKAKQKCEQLFSDKRARNIAPADYNENSEIDKIVKQKLQNIAKDK